MPLYKLGCLFENINCIHVFCVMFVNTWPLAVQNKGIEDVKWAQEDVETLYSPLKK